MTLLEQCCEITGVTKDEFYSLKRHHPIPLTRQLFITVLCNKPPKTKPHYTIQMIADFVEKKNHSYVANSRRNFYKLMDSFNGEFAKGAYKKLMKVGNTDEPR